MTTDTSSETDALKVVDRILVDAVRQRASDVHLEPLAEQYELRLRIDGMLRTVDHLAKDLGRSVVGRLMVMAQLLTYRLNIPQEGRLRIVATPNDVPGGAAAVVEMRLSVMPTTHGVRAVVRLPAELTQPRTLQELRLPARVLEGLRRFAASDTGMLLFTGPAGSGKTTTIYALLEHIVRDQPGLSVISLEDPVERDLPGVTQIEVAPFGELTYEKVLRSILRQDPQVLVLGEIRDAATASIAVQAALSGHRLISTLHAGTPGGAISRLLEMGLEPYQIGSSLFGVVAQRLLRMKGDDGDYGGRLPVAEIAMVDDALRQTVLERANAQAADDLLAQRPDYQTMRDAARQAVAEQLTDDAEVRRVLGAE